MKTELKKPYACPIIIGIILILVGLFIQIPGGVLTTYNFQNGKSADGYYAFDDKYSTIDEYVGGDAYNYIIGASLVAGKTAGIIAAKAVAIVGGVICLCMGVTMLKMEQAKSLMESIADNHAETKSDEYCTD